MVFHLFYSYCIISLITTKFSRNRLRPCSSFSNKEFTLAVQDYRCIIMLTSLYFYETLAIKGLNKVVKYREVLRLDDYEIQTGKVKGCMRNFSIQVI